MASPMNSCRAGGDRRAGYLTGFLIPSDTPFEDRSDVDENDLPDTAGLVGESADERLAAKKGSSRRLVFCMQHDGRWPSQSDRSPPPGTL